MRDDSDPRSVTHDALTGLLGRAFCAEVVDRQLALLERLARPFALILLDIDDLDALSRRFGGRAGDALLRAIGDAVLELCRASDTAVRWGDGAVLVFLPDTDQDGGAAAARRLHDAIARLPTAHGEPISASVGVVAAPAAAGLEVAVAAVEDALRRAQQTGPGRLEIDTLALPN